MIAEVTLKLAEALGVVSLHHATEQVVTNREALKRALSSLLTRSDPVVFGRSDPLLEQD